MRNFPHFDTWHLVHNIPTVYTHNFSCALAFFILKCAYLLILVVSRSLRCKPVLMDSPLYPLPAFIPLTWWLELSNKSPGWGTARLICTHTSPVLTYPAPLLWTSTTAPSATTTAPQRKRNRGSMTAPTRPPPSWRTCLWTTPCLQWAVVTPCYPPAPQTHPTAVAAAVWMNMKMAVSIANKLRWTKVRRLEVSLYNEMLQY